MKPIIGKILRDLVLVFGILFIVWGLYQVQEGKVTHGVGTESVPIDTQMASPGSIIWVHTTSDNTTETRVIKLEKRDAFVQNGTLTDKLLVAGGASDGGRGRNVELTAKNPSLTPTAYRIVVLDADGTNDNIADIEYTVEYTIWMPNYNLILIGFLMIFNAFVFMALSKIQTREVPVDVGAREPEPAMRAPPARAPAAYPPTRGGYPPARGPPARGPPARAPPPETYEEPPPEDEYPPEEPPPEEPEVVAPPPARAPPAAQKPVGRIRCSACGEIIPIFSKQRPVRVTCSNCGRSGTLR